MEIMDRNKSLNCMQVLNVSYFQNISLSKLAVALTSEVWPEANEGYVC
jgi:hypothetical protein